MLKRNLSIFFTVLFMATMVLPSVMVLLEDSFDVSYFYDLSEEEEETEVSDTKDLEVFVAESEQDSFSFLDLETVHHLGYTFKKYQVPHLNIISPPPDYTI